MAHEAIPSNISIIGIKQETTQGTEASGDYRQLLVENFTAEHEVDRSGYSLIAGYKGAYGKNNSGSHVNISFRAYAGTSDSNQATLLDLLYMAMDYDLVAGSNPYTHTMSNANATIAKKSWTIYHDDGRSNYRKYTGFVLDTLNVVVDKSQGVIPVEISGMAWQESDETSKTTNKAANYNIYTPNTGKLLIGATQVDNFNSITINISCATRVHQGINDTGYPSNIDGQDLRLSVTLDGEWNEAAGQVSDALRTAWLNGTMQTSAMAISFGSSSVNDYCTLTLRRWEIESNTNKSLERDTMLPQTLTLYPVWQGDMNNNYWDVTVTNTFNTNAGSL